MDDSLTISGGGSTAVATDELFLDAARLAAAGATLGTWAGRAAGVAAELAAAGLDSGSGWAEPSPADATRRLEQALRRSEHDAEELSASLIASAERYGWAERTVGSFWRIAGGIVAGWLGGAVFSPFGVLTALGIAANLGVARAIGLPSLIDQVASNPSLLSDPMFVRLVRTAVDSADELVGGVAHLPGYSAIGQLVGAPDTASISVALAAALGATALAETAVTVRRESTEAPTGGAGGPRTVTAPAGVADLASRVPSDGRPQIRIERYGGVDDPRWVVYASGTVEPALVAGDEPFDMKSNVAGLADDSALHRILVLAADSGGGERAVRQAMDAAGVAPGDPVMVAGHSGGGIIAASLAGDPRLNVVGAASFGGPTATADLREGVPLLSVEHEEDLVPATGGWGHPSPERLVVSRSVLVDDTTYEGALPAHELSRYRATAAIIDESDEARLVAFRELIGFTGGGTGVVSEWTATRVVSSSTDAR